MSAEKYLFFNAGEGEMLYNHINALFTLCVIFVQAFSPPGFESVFAWILLKGHIMDLSQARGDSIYVNRLRIIIIRVGFIFSFNSVWFRQSCILWLAERGLG